MRTVVNLYHLFRTRFECMFAKVKLRINLKWAAFLRGIGYGGPVPLLGGAQSGPRARGELVAHVVDGVSCGDHDVADA